MKRVRQGGRKRARQRGRNMGRYRRVKKRGRDKKCKRVSERKNGG